MDAHTIPTWIVLLKNLSSDSSNKDDIVLFNQISKRMVDLKTSKLNKDFWHSVVFDGSDFNLSKVFDPETLEAYTAAYGSLILPITKENDLLAIHCFVLKSQSITSTLANHGIRDLCDFVNSPQELKFNPESQTFFVSKSIELKLDPNTGKFCSVFENFSPYFESFPIDDFSLFVS